MYLWSGTQLKISCQKYALHCTCFHLSLFVFFHFATFPPFFHFILFSFSSSYFCMVQITSCIWFVISESRPGFYTATLIPLWVSFPWGKQKEAWNWPFTFASLRPAQALYGVVRHMVDGREFQWSLHTVHKCNIKQTGYIWCYVSILYLHKTRVMYAECVYRNQHSNRCVTTSILIYSNIRFMWNWKWS
jgi:hypothetical protein